MSTSSLVMHDASRDKDLFGVKEIQDLAEERCSSSPLASGVINRSKASVFLWDDERLRSTKIVGQKLAQSAQRVSRVLVCAARFNRFRRKRNAAMVIQTSIRGFHARLQYKLLLEKNEAAAMIQTSWRCFLARMEMKLLFLCQKLDKTTQEKKNDLRSIENRKDQWKRKWLTCVEAEQKTKQNAIEQSMGEAMNATSSLVELHGELSHVLNEYKTGCKELGKSIEKFRAFNPEIDWRLAEAEHNIDKKKARKIQLEHTLHNLKQQIDGLHKSLHTIEKNHRTEKKLRYIFKAAIKSICKSIKKKSNNKKLCKKIKKVSEEVNLISSRKVEIEDSSKNTCHMEDLSEGTASTVNMEDFSDG